MFRTWTCISPNRSAFPSKWLERVWTWTKMSAELWCIKSLIGSTSVRVHWLLSSRTYQNSSLIHVERTVIHGTFFQYSVVLLIPKGAFAFLAKIKGYLNANDDYTWMIQITLRKAYNMGFKHEFSIAIITVTPFINVFIGVCVGGSCIKLTKVWDLNSLKCVFELMMAISYSLYDALQCARARSVIHQLKTK